MHAQLFVPPTELFRRVLAAPILFFLRTPVGDVLNAFARDQVRGCLCANMPAIGADANRSCGRLWLVAC